MPTVDIGDAGQAIERAMLLMIDEGYKALKIEAAVECGDKLAHTQRRDTVRLAASTTATGARPVPHDPGAGFHLPASRVELTQSAESSIPHDPPQANAHVIEAAGTLEGEAYGGYVERRYGLGEAAARATERDSRVVPRAEKRAERKLRGKI